MRRDLRDPAFIGSLIEAATREGASASHAADQLDRYAIPSVKSEGPLERYGDPRDYDVIVETTTRRVPRFRVGGTIKLSQITLDKNTAIVPLSDFTT